MEIGNDRIGRPTWLPSTLGDVPWVMIDEGGGVWATEEPPPGIEAPRTVAANDDGHGPEMDVPF